MNNSRKTTFKVSPRILDHLGLAAYNSLKKCITELVVNAYDADANKVEITIPDAILPNAFLEISDDGLGMSAEAIENDYLFIGRNKRHAQGQTTLSGRPIIGSKGIGKFAGFGIADSVHVASYKDGTLAKVSLNRSDFDDLQALNNQSIEITTSETKRENGTVIRLTGISESVQLPNVEMLRRHLFRALPKRPDFRIVVNAVECTADAIPGVRQEFSEQIQDGLPVSGFYIIAQSKQSQPGLAIRVRGRIVTEPSLFGLTARSHRLFTLDKIVGEINADFLDPLDGSAGHDLINTSRDGFVEHSDLIDRLNSWAHDFLDRILHGIEDEESDRRAERLLKYPNITERLQRMPPHVRSIASKVVRNVIAKLGNVEEEDIADLAEWIVRFYESNVLRELMKAIIAADSTEAEKLAELIRVWGLQQVNSVTEHIRSQIEIIQKLEELVTSDRTREIELHKLIELNLWLIREGLELWSSDKPLKTVLEGHVHSLYEAEQQLRPDIVCRSRDEGTEAVILEFKKPAERIKMEHVTQALKYRSIINAHRPGLRFTTYVIGREYDPVVQQSQNSLTDIFFFGYQEILQKARVRFEDILKILGRD